MYVIGNQYALCVPAIVVIIRRFNVLSCQPVFDVKKASVFVCVVIARGCGVEPSGAAAV